MPAAPSYVLQSVNIKRHVSFILDLIDAFYSLWSRFFEMVFGRLWIRDHIEPSTAAAAASTRNGVPESAELPLDMIEKILHCINPLESARLPFVCKSWAAIVSPRLVSYSLVPHLLVTEMVPRPPGPSDTGFYRRGYMVSVPLDGSARLPSPAIIAAPKELERLITRCGAKLIGATPGGRLALAMSRRVIFINPITDESKTLDVTSVPDCTGLASDSGDTVLSQEYQIYRGMTTTLYWRKQGSEEWSWRMWTTGRNEAYRISSLANCSGFVYVLYRDRSMAKISTNASRSIVIKDINYSRPWRREDDDPRTSRDYLLESDGEVLFVRQLLAQKPNMCPVDYHRLYQTVGFEVYQLDEIRRRWVKVEMLDGDRALFVSAKSSFSLRASQTAGCRSNCIYFVGESHRAGSCRDREDCMSTWGVYSMKEGKVLFEHAVVVTERRTVARWFRPNVVSGLHMRERA
ncbi:hypothetical protein EJB05_24377, partial [Eragrostis curvula]